MVAQVQVAQVGSKVIHTVVTVLTSQILLTALLVVTSLQAAVAADGLVTSMVVATAALVVVDMADIMALDENWTWVRWWVRWLSCTNWAQMGLPGAIFIKY